nr:MAG TPA: hypothetical protein [Caudoviricetes sp.]
MGIPMVKELLTKVSVLKFLLWKLKLQIPILRQRLIVKFLPL